MSTEFSINDDRAAPAALLVDTDAALAELLAVWLGAAGLQVRIASEADAPVRERVDLIVADISPPRGRGGERLQGLAARHPGAPVLALSTAFFAGVPSQGAVARELGVAAVLAKPVTRDALLGAVARLIGVRGA
ncbi:response regulator [Caldimonas sp. KR1-144]|uniref:response regulator n=1 Tax=Caldimonas sp. KR1-144 TaxID=3400911 RepID=UPI003C0CB870